MVSALILLLFGKMLFNYENLKNKLVTTSIQFTEKPVTKKQLLNASDKISKLNNADIPVVSAYNMTQHILVSEDKFHRKATVTLYGVHGVMDCIFPVKLVQGNYVTHDDFYGCVIDQDTANKLFGTSKAVGFYVVVNKKKYYVRGVVDSDNPMMLIEEKKENTEFYHVELRYENPDKGRAAAKKFVSDYLKAGDYTIIEGNFITKCLGNLFLIPFLVIAIYFLIQTIKQIKQQVNDETEKIQKLRYREFKDIIQYVWHIIKKCWLPMIITAFVIACFVFVCNKYGYYPKRYLPTKFSDFDQYVNFYQQIKADLKEFNYTLPSIREVVLRKGVTENIYICIGIHFLMWHLYDLCKMKQGNEK